MSEEKVKEHQNGYLFFLRKVQAKPDIQGRRAQGGPDPEDKNGDMIHAKPDTQGQTAQGDQDPKEGDGDFECPPTPRHYESI